ncbi:PadR family transcriptional regulator [Brevibacterium sp. FAM 27836]|uniref:PadR family transcriptional regulator n=1 Tax=Brevibacterium sp. FAM 27836 TaxID=3446693 RepID=UPI003F5140CF
MSPSRKEAATEHAAETPGDRLGEDRLGEERPTEEQEWLSDRIDSWVETYKKSMLTPVVLHLVARHQPTGITTILTELTRRTGWQITERGLYRTIKRLQDSGLLVSTDTSAPRTGAKRKELSLTTLGRAFLSGITENLIELPGAEIQAPEPQDSHVE